MRVLFLQFTIFLFFGSLRFINLFDNCILSMTGTPFIPNLVSIVLKSRDIVTQQSVKDFGEN